jgi:hypothetical protein
VEVRLQPAGHIHACVLDPTGRPLAGVGTRVKPQNVPGWLEGPRTGDLGKARIGPLPAGLGLRVALPQELHHLVLRDTWSSRGITLQPGETFELPPLTLDPAGRSIDGTLEDAEGRPLPGAQVACHIPVWPVNAAIADEQGRFRLTQLPVRGSDVWLIAADTAKQLYAMSRVDPDSGDGVCLVLRPLTSASGLLGRPSGQVLPAIKVAISPMLRTQYAGLTVYMGWDTPWAPLPEAVETAADGSWRVTGLIAGGMYALQPEVPEARLDLEERIFTVDPDGKPTDFGLMVAE